MATISEMNINGTLYDIQDKRILAIDTSVISGSANPVTGNGIYTALNNILPKYTFTKNLTITTSWQDTGIVFSDMPQGLYAVMFTGTYESGMSWQGNNIYGGIMCWFTGNTNATEGEEIPLHTGGHAHNGHKVYLRTLNHTGNVTNTTLQIRADVEQVNNNVVFKFVKLI